MITWWSEQFLVSRPQNSFVWDETKWMVLNAKYALCDVTLAPVALQVAHLEHPHLTLPSLFYLYSFCAFFWQSLTECSRSLRLHRTRSETRPDQTTRDTKSWETEQRKISVSQNGHVNYSHNCPFISMAPWESSALYLSPDKTVKYFPVPNWDPLCLYTSHEHHNHTSNL
jgi:hypothetical protein